MSLNRIITHLIILLILIITIASINFYLIARGDNISNNDAKKADAKSLAKPIEDESKAVEADTSDVNYKDAVVDDEKPIVGEDFSLSKDKEKKEVADVKSADIAPAPEKDNQKEQKQVVEQKAANEQEAKGADEKLLDAGFTTEEEDSNALVQANTGRIAYKSALTTVFWVGEGASEDNEYISNYVSYWDEDWQVNYGGVDDPEDRCGYYPCSFTPKENPFYFALPYGDYNEDNSVKESVKLIPWYEEKNPYASIIKNKWIKIVYQNKACYAQWEDVGPFEIDDFNYVFGVAGQKNKHGVEAGLDISPATWDCLGLEDNNITEWRFVDESEVPSGPWKEIVTK